MDPVAYMKRLGYSVKEINKVEAGVKPKKQPAANQDTCP